MVRAMIVVMWVVALVAAYWWVILAVLAIAIGASLTWWIYTQEFARFEQSGNHRIALVALADQQHAWVLVGDDRGAYDD